MIDDVEHWRPLPPRLEPQAARYSNVREALEAGPKYFVRIMEAVGSGDGREVALELERLRRTGLVDRLHNGEWHIAGD
jgi:hypothetical protein